MRTTLLGVALLMAAGVAQGQAAPAAGEHGALRRLDLTVRYEWERTNTATGQCGCVYLNGGGVDAAYVLGPRVALGVEVDGKTARNALKTGESLTLVSYMGGVRLYQNVWRDNPAELHTPRLFLELMAGAEHAGGGIAAVADGQYAVVTRFGGGLDVPLPQSKWYLRLPQLDYSYARFPNGVNQHQNDFILSFGLGYRWNQ